MSPTDTPKVGRPRIGSQTNLRLPDVLVAEIDRRAEDMGITRSQYIRDVLEMSISPEADAVRTLVAALKRKYN
jgi:metal-responsive CopG/Arc/MetJ family transcriptional regulator